MQIKVTYASNVNSAPAGFKSTIHDVVRFLEHRYTDPVTINIKVQYQAIGGLGQSLTSLAGFSYHKILTSMTADAASTDDLSAVASLPATDPIGGSHQYYMSTALAKALGLLAGDASGRDGTVTFTNGVTFDYDRSDGIDPSKYDFYGVVAHEFTEVMGRMLLCGQLSGGYTPLDLFHFAGNDNRTFSGTHKGYFSVDNGATKLLAFNSTGSGDFGDWAASAHRDAFLAFSDNGVVNRVSETDLREMDILGWDRAGAAAGIAVADHGGPAHPALDHLMVDRMGAAGYHVAGDWMAMASHAPGIHAAEFA